KLGMTALEGLSENLRDIELRSQMMQASLLAGLAISNTRTALAHSISYPITMYYGVPHGLAASFTLPAILEHNLKTSGGILDHIISQNGFGSGWELLERLKELFDRLGVRTMIREYISSSAKLETLMDEMKTVGRFDNNLGLVDSVSLKEILEK